jgi:excisionase family DNA binding protein
MTNLVSAEIAANSAGISARTIRYWVKSGKLPATQGKRGRLVNYDDVQQILALTGRRSGNPDGDSTSAVRPSGNLAGNDAIASMSGGLPEGLALLRDEWLMPLVNENGKLHEQIGALQRDLEVERQERKALESELEAIRMSKNIQNEQSPSQTTKEPEKAAQKPSHALWDSIRRFFAGFKS